MSNTKSLAAAMQDDFASSSRSELEAYAGQMEVEFHPNIGDDKLRQRLLHKLGREVVEIPGEPKEQPEVDVPSGVVGETGLNELMRLNLTPNGKWDGRRRIVSIVRPEGYKGNQPQPFNWGKMQVMLPYGTPHSVPYPIYNIIKGNNYREIVQIREVGRDGTPRIRNESTMVNRWRFTDFGDDPETANLPESQKEQFKIVAEATNKLRDWDRRQIIRLARRLNVRAERTSEVDDIRELILLKLGYDLDFLDEAA